MTDQIQVTGDKVLHISFAEGKWWYPNDGGDTIVTLSGINVVTAQGGDGGTYRGGNGWSGGGGKNSGAGGFNGGDGGDGHKYIYDSTTGGAGGAGQGTSLPSIKGLNITAGAGGQCSYSYLYHCRGGGGGGVIINGDGGIRDDSRAAQGYGSGGGHYDKAGKSGVVILYF